MTTTPTPTPAPKQRKPRTLLILVQIQAIYLVGASAARLLIMQSTGAPLDALPFVGFALGAVSILAATNWSHR